MEKTPIEIVLADRSPLVLKGLREIFEADPQFCVVATAADGERFLTSVERLSFSVGVIGWDMPFIHGRSVLLALRDRPKMPKIVVFTGSHDPDVAREVMALGGAGFCSKGDSPERLVETVSSVAKGKMVFPYTDVRELENSSSMGLTRRERDILASLAAGRTNAQLAREFKISLNTVKFHLKNLFEKLQVDNRTQAVARYLRGQEVKPTQ